jgi:ankyrin repeat protein
MQNGQEIHTPLSLAKKEGHSQIIKLLKDYGAKE